MRKSKSIVALMLASMMLFGACGSTGATDTPTTTDQPATTAPATTTTAPATSTETVTATEAPVEAIVSEPYVTTYQQDYTTLNYLVSNKSVESEQGFAHFIDTLVQNDKFGAIVPDIATEWSTTDGGTTWVFKLREDVMWVRWDGSDFAQVTAHDWVTSAEYILNKDNASLTVDFYLSYLEGASAYYDDPSVGIETVGVKAIDDFTLQYTCTKPVPFFPSLLTYACFLPTNRAFLDEIGEKNFGLHKDKILYCGSYRLQTWEKDYERILVKNDKYFDVQRVHVPYIRFYSVPSGTVALELYKRGEVSAAGIGTAQLEEAMSIPEFADKLFVTSASTASYFYVLNTESTNKDFATASVNKNFRGALFAAFDLIPVLMLSNPYDQSAMNSGLINAEGVSVLSDGRDYTSLGRLPQVKEEELNNYDPVKAMALLEAAKAELGNTVSWPITVRILGTATAGSETQNALIKQSIEEALGTENIIIETRIYTSDTYYDVMDEGDYDFASSGWSPDYSDPQAYLEIFVPGHEMDSYGFGNIPEWAGYVELLNVAMNITDDLEARYMAFAEAEAYLLENDLVMPFRFAGGNYAINNIQNPYDSIKSGSGICSSKFLDRIYGTEPITVEERAEQREKFNQERAAATGR